MAGEFKVGQDLGFMNRESGFDGLELVRESTSHIVIQLR